MSEIEHGNEGLEPQERAAGASKSWAEIDRRSFLRRTALTGVAAGSVGTILSACGSSGSNSSSAASGGSSSVFGSSKSYKFVFVNHVTTNPFFTPTQYGAADACKLLGCSYQWTGSENSNVSQMVNALNSAVTGGADGIAVALIDLHAFNAPVEAAIKAGIPVVAYNADAAGQRAAGLHRPGPQKGRRKDGRTDRLGGRLGRSGAVHRDARLGQPAAAHRRRRKGDQGVGQADQHRTRSPRGAAVPEEQLDDRSYWYRAQKHEGHVRGRRRQHRKPRQSHAEATGSRPKA